MLPIPFFLLTGFLGSGKTTILNNLLQSSEMQGTAVLMNEIGTVGVDHNLVIGASDDILLLEGGCLCCRPQGSITDGVSRLLSLNPTPKKIVIETSGAANPYPILELLSRFTYNRKQLNFPTVISTFDNLSGEKTLSEFSEARFQLSAADIILITKTDITDRSDNASVQKIISNINSSALVFDSNRVVDREKLVKTLQDQTKLQQHQRFRSSNNPSLTHGETEFQTVGIKFEGFLKAESVQEWIDEILDLYGSNILRIKGILRLQEFQRPVVLQCVRDFVYPLAELDETLGQIKENSVTAIGWEMHPALISEAINLLSKQATNKN